MSQTARFGNTSKRLPIVFCLDVSPSMNWDVDNSDIIPIELLNDSVNTFIREINSDGRTKSSAEVAYVTFSTNIEVDSQFMPARNLDNIHLPIDFLSKKTHKGYNIILHMYFCRYLLVHITS